MHLCTYPLQAGQRAVVIDRLTSICTSSPSADALSIYPQHTSQPWAAQRKRDIRLEKAHVRDLTSNLHDDGIALAYNAASNRSRATSSPDDGGETGSKTIVSDAMRRVACGCTGRRSPIFHVHVR